MYCTTTLLETMGIFLHSSFIQHKRHCIVSYSLPCFLVLGCGIANELTAGDCPAKMSEELLPSAPVVADMYE